MISTLLALLASAPQTYTNPVMDRDMPDPSVLRDGGSFWMTHTTGGPATGWPLYQSKNGREWTFRKHLLDSKNKPTWMNDSFWAPELFRVAKNQYLLTFTAGSFTGRRMLSIGMATAKRIEGPYTVVQAPLVSYDVNALDSHIFKDGNGRLILYWKRDGNKLGVNGTLLAQHLDASGMRFAKGSQPKVVFGGNEKATGSEATWEKGLVEAPWVMRRGSEYFLFYSGAFIDTSYAMGVARSRSPFGPFVRNPANPILKSNATWGGPGHGAFFRDDAGTDFHYYHARRQSNAKAGRLQMLDRVIWRNGWPSFPNGGSPTTTPQSSPVLK